MDLSHRSMAALWMAGFEDDEEQLRCGELCVVEVFGNALRSGSAEVGVGIKAFRDPALTQDFAAPRVDVDVSGFHTYAVYWDADVAVFTVDGEELRRCPHPPTYPLQLMVAVFDFPDDSTGDDETLMRIWAPSSARSCGTDRCQKSSQIPIPMPTPSRDGTARNTSPAAKKRRSSNSP